MSLLENVKIIVGIKPENNEEDALINIYIKHANDFIINYCEVDKVPFQLQSTMEEMVVFSYRQKGVENIDNESKGSLSEKFLSQYPSNIMNILDSYKYKLKQQKSNVVKFI